MTCRRTGPRCASLPSACGTATARTDSRMMWRWPASVTHRHPLAVYGAIAVATAVAHAVTAGEIEPSGFLDTVRHSVEDGSPKFAGHILQLRHWLQLVETAALETIAEVSQRRKYAGFGIPAMAEPTVLASFHALLKSPGDYVETVDCALRIGGDVDTIAAITGAISGAHNGISAIPGNLVAGVKDNVEILDLETRLFARRLAEESSGQQRSCTARAARRTSSCSSAVLRDGGFGTRPRGGNGSHPRCRSGLA